MPDGVTHTSGKMATPKGLQVDNEGQLDSSKVPNPCQDRFMANLKNDVTGEQNLANPELAKT